MVIYLAGYIQGSKIEECASWRKKVREHYEMRELYYVFLDPLSCKNFATITPDGLKSDTPPHAIVHRDRMSIEECDLIVANMDRFGESRSMVGTICELAWGFMLKKPIIMITTETQYKDHPFLSYFVSACYDTVDDMLGSGIIEYFNGGIQNAVY